MSSVELPFDRPLDQPARDRIAGDLDAGLFVEAGAGAGKTASLVSRIVALVESGVDVGAIAAITFTEKAAAELRHRVRNALVDAGLDDAATGLDHAPIGTLHAFARRMLNDFPVAAGLPPGFTVLDELESHLAIEERWRTRVSTSTLNSLLERWVGDKPPPRSQGRAVKIYYGTQVSSRPPVFKLFVNTGGKLYFSYERYLVNRIREAFDFEGVPIRLVTAERKQRRVR